MQHHPRKNWPDQSTKQLSISPLPISNRLQNLSYRASSAVSSSKQTRSPLRSLIPFSFRTFLSSSESRSVISDAAFASCNATKAHAIPSQHFHSHQRPSFSFFRTRWSRMAAHDIKPNIVVQVSYPSCTADEEENRIRLSDLDTGSPPTTINEAEILPRQDGGRGAWLFLVGACIIEGIALKSSICYVPNLIARLLYSYGVFRSYFFTHAPFEGGAYVPVPGVMSNVRADLLFSSSSRTLTASRECCRCLSRSYSTS